METSKIQQDGRGQAIEAVVKRIGYGISVEQAKYLIEVILVNYQPTK